MEKWTWHQFTAGRYELASANKASNRNKLSVGNRPGDSKKQRANNQSFQIIWKILWLLVLNLGETPVQDVSRVDDGVRHFLNPISGKKKIKKGASTVEMHRAFNHYVMLRFHWNFCSLPITEENVYNLKVCQDNINDKD